MFPARVFWSWKFKEKGVSSTESVWEIKVRKKKTNNRREEEQGTNSPGERKGKKHSALADLQQSRRRPLDPS